MHSSATWQVQSFSLAMDEAGALASWHLPCSIIRECRGAPQWGRRRPILQHSTRGIEIAEFTAALSMNYYDDNFLLIV